MRNGAQEKRMGLIPTCDMGIDSEKELGKRGRFLGNEAFSAFLKLDIPFGSSFPVMQ